MCLFPGLAPSPEICHLCTCLALLYMHPDYFSLFTLHWDKGSQIFPKMRFIEPVLLFIFSIIEVILINWSFRHWQFVNFLKIFITCFLTKYQFSYFLKYSQVSFELYTCLKQVQTDHKELGLMLAGHWQLVPLWTLIIEDFHLSTVKVKSEKERNSYLVQCS